MSWNVTCGAGGTLAGRKAFILKVSGFKHQGAVVIFPNSLDGYFDIELIDESGEVVESVEYISACKLSEIIDQLVEVTENYSDDIVRWLRKCTPNENQIQKKSRFKVSDRHFIPQSQSGKYSQHKRTDHPGNHPLPNMPKTAGKRCSDNQCNCIYSKTQAI